MTFRISPELWEELDEFCRRTGIDKTQLVEESLRGRIPEIGLAILDRQRAALLSSAGSLPPKGSAAEAGERAEAPERGPKQTTASPTSPKPKPERVKKPPASCAPPAKGSRP